MKHTCAVKGCSQTTDTAGGWWVVVLPGGNRSLCPRHSRLEIMNRLTVGEEVETAPFDLSDTLDSEAGVIQARLDELFAYVAGAEPTLDEVDALELLIKRVFGKGRANYGSLRLVLDSRDFETELLEETLDAQFYASVRLAQLRRARRSS